MTTVVITETRYVEPDELVEMLKDAIRRTPVGLCDADLRTFRLEGFSTDHADHHISSSGEGRIEASLCHRPSTECRVEFETMGVPPDEADDNLTPMEVSLRVIEDVLPE